VAEDGSGQNSPYTDALAKAMLKPNVKIEDVFKEARSAVEAATDNKQVPWETTSITGDFFFTRKAPNPPAAPTVNPDRAATAAPSAPPPAPSVAADEAAWRKIAASTNPSDFAGFLHAFPQSAHAADAKARQASLAPAGQAAVVA